MELCKLCFRKFFPSRKDGRQDILKAQHWCEDNVTEFEFVFHEFFPDVEIKGPIRDIYEDEFSDASQRAEKVKNKMGGAAHLDLIFNFADALKASRVLETGVAYGWSSLAFLLSLSKRDNSLLVSVDRPYPREGSDKYVGCVVPEKFYGKWKLIRYADRQGIPKAFGYSEFFDLAHYDSDKSYHGKMWALKNIWSKLRSSGILISDDIGDNLAFKDFADLVSAKAYVVKISDKYVGILKKS